MQIDLQSFHEEDAPVVCLQLYSRLLFLRGGLQSVRLILIISGDVKLLSSIKGLGKKTTERIVLELNNKLGGETALESLISSNEINTGTPALNKEMEEAYDVLTNMGVQKATATESVKNNYTAGMTSEQLVLECLKNLHK